MECSINNKKFNIINYNKIIKPQNIGYMCSIELTLDAKDLDIDNLYITCDFCIPQKNYIIQNPIASIFSVEYDHIPYSKVEVLEDDAINWYGTLNLHWKEPFNKDVPFEIILD